MNDGIPYWVSITSKAGVGDHLCLLSACREFTRRTGSPVYTESMPDVIAAYRDPDLRYGRKGIRFQISPREAHRSKEPLDYVNYYGTYLASMGLMRKGDPAKLELPAFDQHNMIESHVVIQPFSVFAQNPPLEYVQSLVDHLRDLTGVDVYVVGREDTPKSLKRVKYVLLQNSVTNLLRIIQSASFVMAPRSLVAHVAAGYQRPAFIWTPNDGENWHLDYPDWPHVLHPFSNGSATGKEVLQLFLKMKGLL